MTRCASLVSLASVFASVLALSSCMVVSGDSSSEQDVASATTTYIDLVDFSKVDQGAWYDAISKLNGEFAAVCGDTFCEGDYANLTPLTFACTVSSKEGTVHDCAWTFTGSQVEVEPTTAVIQTDVPTFACHVTTKTSAVKLLTFLTSTPDSLRTPLPGAASIYDQIADCLQHPTGGTPIVAGPQTPVTYVAASEYYTSAASQAKWASAQANLLAGFNNICGDTFCSSDFNDIQSLDFECAVTKSSGNIKGCAWVFGGSFHGAGPKGIVAETMKSFRCNVAVKGTLPQLIATLTGSGAPGTAGPIDRPLPGETTSAYDALGGCLP